MKAGRKSGCSEWTGAGSYMCRFYPEWDDYRERYKWFIVRHARQLLTLGKKFFLKKRPTSGCFSCIRRFFFHEMRRFHQMPHKLALFRYLLLLKVQCFSDGRTSGWSFHWLREIHFHPLMSKEAVCWPPACTSLLAFKPFEQHEIKFSVQSWELGRTKSYSGPHIAHKNKWLN